MRIIIKRVDKSPEVSSIDKQYELTSLQNIVGGYIEAVHITNDIVLICNEEGKLIGLHHNFNLKNGIKIVGDVCFSRDNHDGEFTDLTDEDIEKIISILT